MDIVHIMFILNLLHILKYTLFMYYIIFYVYQCRIITTISILMDPPFKTFHIKLIVIFLN